MFEGTYYKAHLELTRLSDEGRLFTAGRWWSLHRGALRRWANRLVYTPITCGSTYRSQCVSGTMVYFTVNGLIVYNGMAMAVGTTMGTWSTWRQQKRRLPGLNQYGFGSLEDALA